MQHPKPYLILVQYEYNSRWSVRAEYEQLETAEMHALDILLTEHPIDLKIVKDLGVSIKTLKKD